MTTTAKAPRGGARPGAGRPRKKVTAEDRRRQVSAGFGLIPLADVEVLVGVSGADAVRALGIELVTLGREAFADRFGLQAWIDDAQAGV